MSEELQELLEELAHYFDDRMDINNNGGPNEAMQFYSRIQKELSKCKNQS